MLTVRFLISLPETKASQLLWQDCPDILHEDDTLWLPASAAPNYVEQCMESYLSLDRLSCCSFQGGFVIETDGTPWNWHCVDEFHMTTNWFRALITLLTGQASTVNTYVWEESDLRLIRHDTQIEMYENRYRALNNGVHQFCPPITVDLLPFARTLHTTAQPFAVWLRAISAEVDRRLHQPVAPDDPTLPKLRTMQEQLRTHYADEIDAFGRLLTDLSLG